MQDRYAGDIGDFGKFALLQELEKQGVSIGVNWYKTDSLDWEKNADGSFKQDDGKYKAIPKKLRDCAPCLAEKLIKVSDDKNGNRSLKALQDAKLLNSNAYYDVPVSTDERDRWHRDALRFFTEHNSDLVFLDPDNGLLVKSVGKQSARSVKYAFYEEVLDYIEQGKSVLIYNHRSRKPELEYFKEIEENLHSEIAERALSEPTEIFEITFPRYSIRDYIAVSACQEHARKIRKAFEIMWSGEWVDNGLTQKPLTMDITFSEYRARFPEKSCKKFLKYYRALPEEVMLAMIRREEAGTTVKACAASAWYS